MAQIDCNKEHALSFVQKYCPKVLQPTKKNENKFEIAKKISHLYLNNKVIRQIGELKPFINLTVLYLHENQIKKIENINPCANVTHLYLQRNEIKKIENLQNLTKLRKLYLGYNQISVIEGLENLKSLIELHVEKQDLEKCDSLCFDPRSIVGIQDTLKVLNISDDNVFSLNEIKNLYNLETLVAKNNKIHDLEQTANEISNLIYLKDLTLIGNPIVRQLKYRDRLIVKSNKLKTIDDKEVRENTRVFLKNFEKGKLNNMKTEGKYELPIPDELSSIPLALKTELKKSVHKIPPGKSMSCAITVSEKQKPSESTLDSNLTGLEELYVPWNKLPKTVGLTANNNTKRNNNSPLIRNIHTLQT